MTVEQDGALSAGGDGIVADSKAVAVADLEQKAKQKNETEAELTLEGPVATIGGPVTEQETESIGLQGQLVGQLNASAQLGLTFADADLG